MFEIERESATYTLSLVDEFRLREQTGEQRNESRADQHNTAASHELFDALRFSTGVIIAVAFHQVDYAPHCQTSTEGDNESLQNRNCLSNECHKLSSLTFL